MSIKELREAHGLSQVKCAEYLNIPIRTYKRYEAYEEKVNKIKYQYIIDKLHELDFIDETHGKLSIDQIKSIVNDVLSNYNVDFCYLFGSYAKGKETEKSDIDLLISMPLNGFVLGILNSYGKSSRIPAIIILCLACGTPYSSNLYKFGYILYPAFIKSFCILWNAFPSLALLNPPTFSARNH